MLELPVAALLSHEDPSVVREHTQDFAHLHPIGLASLRTLSRKPS
jgi:hypothetical protein